MLNKECLRALIVSSFFIFIPAVLHAQATGSISGRVTDASGASVSGAKVTVSGEVTGLVRETKTDSGGRYVVPLLGVASYKVRAEFTGFQTSESTGVRLQVDEQRESISTCHPPTCKPPWK